MTNVGRGRSEGKVEISSDSGVETATKRGNIEDYGGCTRGGVREEEVQGVFLGVENGTKCIVAADGGRRRGGQSVVRRDER